MSMVQVSALEDLWKATPDAKVEDLDAAEVGIGGCTALTISQILAGQMLVCHCYGGSHAVHSSGRLHNLSSPAPVLQR